MTKTIAALEALLFIHGEPLTFKKAAKILKVGEKQVQEAARQLSEELTKAGRGLALLINSDALQLVTKPDFSSLTQKLIKEDVRAELTPAALETISIVAYGGPISKAEIEYIRGVNSSFILRNLLMRGLINRSADGPSGSYLYQASFDLLKHLGLGGADQLPGYEQYRTLINKWRNKENARSNTVS